MTPQHPLLNDWQQRTESLQRLIKKNSKSAWIFEIRVKILNYFISRYGSALRSSTNSAIEQIPPRLAPHRSSLFIAGHSPSGGLPPKSPEVIRPLLEDIHRIVESSRIKLH